MGGWTAALRADGAARRRHRNPAAARRARSGGGRSGGPPSAPPPAGPAHHGGPTVGAPCGARGWCQPGGLVGRGAVGAEGGGDTRVHPQRAGANPPPPPPPGPHSAAAERVTRPNGESGWRGREREVGGGGAAGGNAAAAALRVARDGGRGGGGAELRSAGGCNGGRVEGRADGFLRLGASSRHWRWGAVGRGRDLWDLAGGGPPLHSAIAGGGWAKRLAATAARDAAALRPAAPYLTDPRLYLLVCTVNRYKFQNVICGFDRGLAGRKL